MDTLNPEQRYRAIFTDAYADVLRFVRRRCDADRAEDVTAQAFLVAWRRVAELPTRADDARAWLFGIARNCLLNDHRGRRRQEALAVRIKTVSSLGTADALDETVARRVDLGAAWNRLDPGQQEVLGLAVFEQLASPQAGAVLGISATAFRLRLSRARAALRNHLDGTPATTPTMEEVSS